MSQNLISVYRLEDANGIGPILNSIGAGTKLNANPYHMDNYIIFSDGDDPHQFKYGCSSEQNLINYFGKVNFRKLIGSNFSVVILKINEDEVRFTNTGKVLAFKFTDRDDMWPTEEMIKRLELNPELPRLFAPIKKEILKEYYLTGSNLDERFMGPVGLNGFIGYYLQLRPELGYLFNEYGSPSP